MATDIVSHVASALGTTRGGALIVWISLLIMTAVFREMAHHCTAYDEEHSIARARVVSCRLAVCREASVATSADEHFRIDSVWG